MPNIKGAVKRVQQAETAKEANIAKKNKMRTAVKKAKTAKENNADNANELVNFAVKLVDKASQDNLIHVNKASRIKSQLMAK